MSGRVTGRRAPLLLLVLCLGLCGVIFLETRGGSVEATAYATPSPHKAATAHLAPPTFVMPPLRAYAEVTARPLFSETRRPPAANTAVADVSGFTLVGIVISASEHRALIEHGRPPRLERVVEGQELEGWTIEQVLPDRVVLRRGDTRVELKPRDKPGKPSPQSRSAPAPHRNPVLRLQARPDSFARGRVPPPAARRP